MIYSLVHDFAAALVALPEAHPRRRTLALLEEAIRRDVHFIDRHPTTLFQCLWNSCWWYDCPEAEDYYDEPRVDRINGRQSLSPLLESWKEIKSRDVPGALWLRSLRPPPIRLGAAHRAVMRGHLGAIYRVVFSPDGSRVASASGDQIATIWDAATGVELASLDGHNECVMSVNFSPDGRWVVTGGYDRMVRIWDANSGQQLRCLQGHSHWIWSAVFSPDGRRIASLGKDRTIRLWDAETGTELHCFREFDDLSGHIAFSPDGKQIASPTDWSTVRVLDVGAGQPGPTFTPVSDRMQDGEFKRIYRAMTSFAGLVTEVTYSPDGQHILGGASDNSIHIWDAATGNRVRRLEGHTSAVNCVVCSRDGRLIASGSRDRTVRIWDAPTGDELRCFRGHLGDVMSVDFSPDGRYVVSGARDRTVMVWVVEAHPEYRRLPGHAARIHHLAASADGRLVASIGYQESVRTWDARCGTEVDEFPAPDSGERVGFSPDSRYVANWSYGTSLRIWDVKAGQERHHIVGAKTAGGGTSHYIQCLAFSPDGRHFAHGATDDLLLLCDTLTGTTVGGFQGAGGSIAAVTFAADDTRIAWSSGPFVSIGDLTDGSELCRFDVGQSSIGALAFAPDGRFLVAGLPDGGLRVWDAVSFREMHTFRGHRKDVTGVAFSPDGQRIATAARDRTTRVWNFATPQRVTVLPGLGDLDAVAAGAPQFPWLALVRELETVVGSTTGLQPAAWFPAPLEHLIALSSRVWAGSVDSHLYLFALEGAISVPSTLPGVADALERT